MIIKDDPRYGYTEDYLCSKGHTFQEPGLAAENLDFIIFPFKEEVDKARYNEGFFASLRKETLIFSGVRSAYITEQCAACGLEYQPMMDDRGTQIRNAVPTSEGVIAYLIMSCNHTLANSRVLIIGYGVCGRDLAKRLAALGAEMYALVRNREKECTACADSVTPIYLDDFASLRFDIIINTVPGRVLSDEMLEHTAGALLVDIASKPYGFDMEVAQRLNPKSALLPGIPGKYAVRTAGEILGAYVHNVLARR